MPSRKRSVKTCEFASRSPNETGPTSLAVCSDMSHASTLQTHIFVVVVVVVLDLAPTPWRAPAALRSEGRRVKRKRDEASDIVAVPPRIRAQNTNDGPDNQRMGGGRPRSVQITVRKWHEKKSRHFRRLK